jgi:DNA-binding CsgD family transcriptional regulator
MTVFSTEMHLATFIFLVFEVLFFVSQLVLFLENPNDKIRKYYLILLGLLILYNIAGGLFPDPNLSLDINLQINLAYGAGFAMGSYFPFYFYKVFGLDDLEWHAKKGIWYFFVTPFILSFGILLPLSGDLANVIWYGMAIPVVYAIYLDTLIFLFIRKKYRDDKHSLDAILSYAAMCPWVFLPIFSYFETPQFLEVMVTNLGFVVITFLFIRKMIYENRKAFEKLSDFDRKNQINHGALFYQRCVDMGLTKREAEVVEQVALGLTSKEIAEKLFISERTVNKHLQTVYKKSESKNRVELINSLNSYS